MEAPLSFVKYKLGKDYRRKSRGCACRNSILWSCNHSCRPCQCRGMYTYTSADACTSDPVNVVQIALMYLKVGVKRWKHWCYLHWTLDQLSPRQRSRRTQALMLLLQEEAVGNSINCLHIYSTKWVDRTTVGAQQEHSELQRASLSEKCQPLSDVMTRL